MREAIRVGDRLPALELPPVARTVLGLFASGSGDHNPIHIDPDFARRAGMPDVFAHGMLGMAWVGRLVTQWIPQSCLRSYGVRFADITQLGDVITCSGEVVELLEFDGEPCARLALTSVSQHGKTKIVGEAIVAVAKEPKQETAP